MTKDTASQGAESVVGLYELMLILNPELRESEMKKKFQEFEESLVKAGGKIVHTDFWGKRALAYRIKKKDEGYYQVYNVEMPTDHVKEVRESLRIDKEVVRSMIVRLPEGHVYTKYDLTFTDDPKLKKEFFQNKKYTSSAPRHMAPAKPVAKTEDKGKEASKVDLDKKLDAIIGGADLKL